MSRAAKQLKLDLVKNALPLIITVIVAYIEAKDMEVGQGDYLCDNSDDYLPMP